MEPISLAMGVVPLAMNIVQMSSAIREKVSTYRSAPEEIQSIMEKTTLIGHICEQLDLEVALEASQSQFHSDMLERALKMCCLSLAGVQNDLEKVTKSQSHRKQSLSYLFSKSNIEKRMFSLNDSLNMLNTCINLSLLSSMSVRKVDVSGGAPTSCLHAETKLPTHQSKALARQKQRKQRLKVKQQVTDHQNALVHYHSVHTSTRHPDNELENSQSRSYLFGVPLIGTYISLAMRYGGLNPFELTIDTPQYIYETNDKAFYDQIMDKLSGDDEEKDELRWARQLNLKPNTQLVSRSGQVESALAIMMGMIYRSQTFKHLLAQQEKTATDCQLLTPMPMFRHRVGSGDYDEDPALLYVEARGPFLTLDEYCDFMTPHHHPSFLDAMFEACKDILQEENLVAFVSRSAMPVVQYVSCCFTVDQEKAPLSLYGTFVRKLRTLGFDIHSRMPLWGDLNPFEDNSGQNTILGSLLSSCDCCQSWEHLASASKWLEILSCASVNVSEYLDRELEIFLVDQSLCDDDLEQWQFSSLEEKLYIMCSNKFPDDERVSDEIIDALPATRRTITYRINVFNDSPTHLDWKHERLFSIETAWPYPSNIECSQEENRGLRNLPESIARKLESFDRFESLMDERFQRNQERKWRKLKKRVGLDGREDMPGSWNMEWWEYQGAW